MKVIIINEARCSEEEIDNYKKCCDDNNVEYIVKPLPPVYGKTCSPFNETATVETAVNFVDTLLERYGTKDVTILRRLSNLFDEFNHRVAQNADTVDIDLEVSKIFNEIRNNTNELHIEIKYDDVIYKLSDLLGLSLEDAQTFYTAGMLRLINNKNTELWEQAYGNLEEK